MKNKLINEPIILTKRALKKIKKLFYNNKNVNFRIFIIGGGCSGFKYDFMLDKKIKKNDIITNTLGINIVIDKISIQYLYGSVIDYIENIEESKFIIKNLRMKNTCSCGSSFDI
ncbi:iron-sulfur cluster insertion protein ErpA [Enterobacteriaceae endosymbiont of Donacia versicolorea]|uniref:iron-sulfur cluster insertion protein ErpA n=1 Tax=Enterobacteriaceae endosymbiont of Donacia versicolorea TaxID=2675788 RepID=UPI0014499F6B|nr:iron-sulfur cluster insertion protein ErpA [Enterobacteriaceae endosymbiont of Donacia versicolorea]QJC31943.1 iron-sulfur cluster insertion protein ErpA [Enterobacteriaceae endosymbiont of Donacia versicolorea]